MLTDYPQNVTTNQLSINKPAVALGNSTDRKFNVVIYGIKENPSGTPWSARTRSDIDSSLHILKEANNDISEHFKETACVWESLAHKDPNLDHL